MSSQLPNIFLQNVTISYYEKKLLNSAPNVIISTQNAKIFKNRFYTNTAIITVDVTNATDMRLTFSLQRSLILLLY